MSGQEITPLVSGDTVCGLGEKNINNNTVKRLVKRFSASDLSLKSDKISDNLMNATRVNELKSSVSKHNDNVIRILLTCKESQDKKAQIESAFRACKEALFELSASYLSLLAGNGSASLTAETFRDVVRDALSGISDSLLARVSGVCPMSRKSLSECASSAPTYASVVDAELPKVRVARSTSIDVPKSTILIVVPKEDSSSRYASPRETKSALLKVIKPSDFNLKIKKISSTRNNGVRIEAQSVDLGKMRDSPELEGAGLKIKREGEINPRLLIQGVPCGLSREEIKEEIIALNLDKSVAPEIRVVYIFPTKNNRSTTNYVIEVSPHIRARLLGESRIFINYSACGLIDYIRVIQCFKCLAFGHFARHCKFTPLCGHCARNHETKDCNRKNGALVCGNCKRWTSLEIQHHSALDGGDCPILRRRIMDRMKSVNYG